MKRPLPWPYAIATLLVLACCIQRIHAQVDRYELGLHLKALEEEWASRKPEEASRRRAVEPLKKSVALFFQARFGAAAQQLDAARFALKTSEPNAGERWAAALAIRPQTRLLDANARELEFELYAFYPQPEGRPTDPRIRVTAVTDRSRSIVQSVDVAISKIPQKIMLPLDQAEEDCILVVEIRNGQTVLATSRQSISRITDLAARVEKLRAAVAKIETKSSLTESLRHHVKILEQLSNRKPLETDYPAVRLIREAEAMSKAISKGNSDLLKNRPGEWWLALVSGSRVVPARLFAPEEIKKGKDLPLVIALHGAGGSENMFFEGYGAGAVVKLCRERGWIVVAPRSEGFGSGNLTEMIEELARLYPIDRQRVLVVGHSMGAAQAVAAAGQSPKSFAGIAALGGGGLIRDANVFKTLPLFIGCGVDDFALGMSRSLTKSVQKIDGAKIEAKEYPDIEHLMIVQVALPDVFTFFDRCAAAR